MELVPSKFKNVANFILAYILSAFGYEFIFFVMTLYVYDLRKDAINISLFIAITFIPRLFSPLFGFFVDRYSRKAVFIVSLILVISLILIMGQTQELFFVYLVWSLISFLLGLISNVRTALMTEIMSQDGYLLGNSMVLIFLNTARILGPLLGAVVLKITSLVDLFYLTAIIYALTLLVTLFLQLPARPAITKQQANFLQNLKEGFLYIKESPQLLYLNYIALIRCLFVGMFSSLFVVYVKSYLSRSSTDYGVFMSTLAVGSILGSLIGPWLIKRFDNNNLVTWTLVIYYSLLGALGLSTNYYLSLFMLFFSFASFYAGVVRLHSQRDIATVLNLRGRVYASVSALQTLAFVFSILAGGWLANIFGVEKVMLGAGFLGAISHFVLTTNYKTAFGLPPATCQESAAQSISS